METKIWQMKPNDLNLHFLEEAAELLKKGELIGFPTETVYGLGANGLDTQAIEKIYQAKGRPSDNPLILHIANVEAVKDLVSQIPEKARILMEKFWPGPLTLVLPKSEVVPAAITAGLNTVALRMPSHPVAFKLIEISGLPIAAPSANLSGKPSPTTAEHVYEDLNGKIAGIIDAGRAGVGVESTVVDMTTEMPTILRPGGISQEDLIAEIGIVNFDSDLKNSEEAPRSPGMKYTHYSPDADLVICVGSVEEIAKKINGVLHNNNKTGLMISQETYDRLGGNTPDDLIIQVLGKRNDLREITSKIFATLRWFDKQGVDIIYTEQFPETNIGVALMNRLYKAAGGKII